MRRVVEGPDVSFLRPFLDLTRAQTERACRAQGIEPWSDPHNEDPRFTRVRVRHRVLPVLEEELGPGVAVTLARTADLLREDMELLDRLADEALDRATTADGGLDAAWLGKQPPALATRVLRRALVAAGSPPAEVTKGHVDALADLMRDARGRRLQLPGHVTAYLDPDRTIRFRRTGP
jgi:tRNA(Ile)-lysidine synthase